MSERPGLELEPERLALQRSAVAIEDGAQERRDVERRGREDLGGPLPGRAEVRRLGEVARDAVQLLADGLGIDDEPPRL